MEDIDGAKDTLDEISDAVREIYERGKDEYFDLESQIRDALEGERQKEIDKLLELSQGFYYLKRESENRVFIILQNSTTEANTYPRHNLEFAEL